MIVDKAVSIQDPQIYANMQVGEPYKRYKKNILGKIYLNIIDPFSGNPVGIILKGDPRKNQEGCFLDTWSIKEDVYLHKANPRHFNTKPPRIVEVSLEEKPQEAEVNINSMSDEEMESLLNSKGFLKLFNTLTKMTSIATVDRLLMVAELIGKSEKIMDAIKNRRTELQSEENKRALREG